MMMKRLFSAIAALALVFSALFAGATASSAATANTPCTSYRTQSAGTMYAAVVPTTSAGSSDCYLVQGNQGTGVAALQRALIYCESYSVGSYGADGVFGAATKSAVRSFQVNRAITADGEYGNQVRNRIYFLSQPVSPVSPSDYYYCNWGY